MGLGPIVGSSLGLAAYLVVLADAAKRGDFLFSVLGLVQLALLTYLIGAVLGLAPALLSGVAGGFLHRSPEPVWRSLLIGSLLGGPTAGVSLLAMNGLQHLPSAILLSFTIIGAFAGVACALLQRTESARLIG